MSREIRIRLEGIADDGVNDAYDEALICMRLFREELPGDHKDCYYVSRLHNVWVYRTPKGTLIARVRPEVGSD